MKQILIILSILFSLNATAQVDTLYFSKEPQKTRVVKKANDGKPKYVYIKNKFGDILIYTPQGTYLGKYMRKEGKYIFKPKKP